MPERFECTTLAKKRYINTLPFLSFLSNQLIFLVGLVMQGLQGTQQLLNGTAGPTPSR